MGEMSPKAKNIYDQRDRKWLAERVAKLEAELDQYDPDCRTTVKQLEAENALLKTYAQKLEGPHSRADVITWRERLGLFRMMSEWVIPDKHRQALKGGDD